jgi:hypothetical protein
MTIEEFRAYGGLVEPPQLYFPVEKQLHPVFSDSKSELVAKGPVTFGGAQDSGRLKAIENSSGQQETLKLKRSKPLARAASKLESTLGITHKSSK